MDGFFKDFHTNVSRDDLLRTVTFYANVTEVNNTPLLLLLINEAACLLMIINIIDRNIILNLGSSVPENTYHWPRQSFGTFLTTKALK